MTTTKQIAESGNLTDREDVGDTNNSQSEFEEEGQGTVTSHGMTTGDATTDGAMARTASLAKGMVYPAGVVGKDAAPFTRKDGTALNQAVPGRSAAVTAQLRSSQR